MEPIPTVPYTKKSIVKYYLYFGFVWKMSAVPVQAKLNLKKTFCICLFFCGNYTKMCREKSIVLTIILV